MDFSVTTKEIEYGNKVKKFIIEKIKPCLGELYREQKFPIYMLPELYKSGLMGFWKKEHKWEMEQMTHNMILYEKLAEVSPGLAAGIMAHTQMGIYAIYRWGNIWQKEEFLQPSVTGQKLMAFAHTETQAGSDAVNIKTYATRVQNGYLLNGEKAYITNGYDASTFLVTAITEQKQIKKKESISLFVIDGKANGIERINLRKNIWVPASMSRIIFRDCFVPEENIIGGLNKGFNIIMKIFTSLRIIMSSIIFGSAFASYKMALRYACRRKVFDVPIFEHQVKAFEFADKLTKLEASRLLIKKSAWLRDMGQRYTLASSMAKLHTVDMAKDVINWAREILGATSVFSDHPINIHSNDIDGFALAGGSSDIQKLIIARFMELWDNWDEDMPWRDEIARGER